MFPCLPYRSPHHGCAVGEETRRCCVLFTGNFIIHSQGGLSAKDHINRMMTDLVNSLMGRCPSWTGASLSICGSEMRSGGGCIGRPQMDHREVVNFTSFPFLSKVIRAKW